MGPTPLELIVFPSLLVLFALTVALLAVWTIHRGHRSPVSPKRQWLRTYRELSPMEFAVAAHRDPATALVAAVIDLVQSGKAAVTGFSPLRLERGPRPIVDAREQRVVDAFGIDDLDARGEQLLAALEDTCEALSQRMEGYSVGFTLRHYKQRCRRVLSMATHRVGATFTPQAIDRALPWLVAADGAWQWADDLAEHMKPDTESAKQMLLQGAGLDADTCGQVLGVLLLLRPEVIRLEDLVDYLTRHGDHPYLKGREIDRTMREGVLTSCSAHPDERASRLCRLCLQPVCSACFSNMHGCCAACAFPHVRVGADRGPELAPEFFAASLPDYVKRIAPGLLALDFKPAVDSRYPAYVDLAGECDAIFTNAVGATVDLLCVAALDAFADRDIEPFLERIYRVVAAFPCLRRRGGFLLPSGVLVLLAATPVPEERVKDLMKKSAGLVHGGIVVRPWIVDLGARQVHARAHLDGPGELSSRDVVAVLEAALS